MKPYVRHALTLAAISVMFLSLACCAGVAGEGSGKNDMKSASNGGDVAVSRVLTADDNGGGIAVEAGNTIRVDLEVQGGTGYNWYVDGLDERLLRLKKTETVPGSKMAGAPVLGMWYFQAISPGDTELKMLYYRTWEGKEKAIKSFTVRIHIVAK